MEHSWNIEIETFYLDLLSFYRKIDDQIYFINIKDFKTSNFLCFPTIVTYFRSLIGNVSHIMNGVSVSSKFMLEYNQHTSIVKSDFSV